MKWLLDECVPRRLKREFINFEVFTIEQAGFKGLKNGNLLREASKTFKVLITVDKNLEYQQNKKDLPMAILILSARSNRFESPAPLISLVKQALEKIETGDVIKIEL